MLRDLQLMAATVIVADLLSRTGAFEVGTENQEEDPAERIQVA
jgi:hypothetical protein